MEKFEVELKIVKSKIHEEDLREDFRDKLVKELENRYDNNVNVNNNKCKVLRRPIYFCKSVAAVFVCFVLLSTCAFADDIEDMIKSIFSNVSPNAELAYEEGNCIEVDSEYQTYGDVSAKVAYVSLKDKELYIVFDIQTEESFDKIYLEGLKLEDENGEIRYLSSYNVKKESTSNCKLIAKLTLKNYEEKNIENLNITFESIVLEDENKNNINIGNWLFDLNLENKKD